MTLRAAKSRRQKGLHQFPGECVAHYEAPETDYIQVIVFNALVRGEAFMDQAGAHPRHFVRRDRCPDAAPTDGNAAFQVSASYRLGERYDKVRVIICLIPMPVTEFDYVITGFAQFSREISHQFQSSVVGGNTDALECSRKSRHRGAVQAVTQGSRGGLVRQRLDRCGITAVLHYTPLVSGMRLGGTPLCPLAPSWPIPMVSAVIPASPPSCMLSTAVLGTITIVEFSFKPS